MMRSRKKGMMAKRSTRFMGCAKKTSLRGAQTKRIYEKKKKKIIVVKHIFYLYFWMMYRVLAEKKDDSDVVNFFHDEHS
jgi:hypothetical protein